MSSRHWARFRYGRYARCSLGENLLDYSDDFLVCVLISVLFETIVAKIVNVLGRQADSD